jgi:hypothetical protein
MSACTTLPRASIRYSGRLQRRGTGLPGLLNAIFGFSALARNEIRSQPSPFAAKSLGRSLGRGPTPRFDPLARHGIECPTITGAGTGSFEFEAVSGVYTELQCDSYIFMDADYGRNPDRDGAPTEAFEPSLFVWATVMSRPAGDRAIVNAGLKALAFDSGPPLVCDEVASVRTLPEPGLRRSAELWRPARSTLVQAAASARAFRRITCGGCPKARRKARRMRSRSAKPVCRAMTSIGWRLCSIISRAVSIRRFSTALAGDWPVSARNARLNWRGLKCALRRAV